jgi:hypothetical protein
VSDELGMSYGNDLLDSLTTWYFFYSMKMLEKKDRQQIERTGKKAIKLVALSLLAGGFANRFLTYLKIKDFEFINLRLIFRLPIRLTLYGLIFQFFALNPILSDVENLYYNLHDKYYPRFELLKTTSEPLSMNAKMLNEEGMTEDEKDDAVLNYQRTKETLMMAKHMKQTGGF